MIVAFCVRQVIPKMRIFLAGSGLFFASKYPIMDAHFHQFKVKSDKLMMKLCDYGCTMAKVDLGKDRVSG